MKKLWLVLIDEKGAEIGERWAMTLRDFTIWPNAVPTWKVIMWVTRAGVAHGWEIHLSRRRCRKILCGTLDAPRMVAPGDTVNMDFK